MSADNMITTSTGTTVRITSRDDGERVIILDSPDAPDDMRNTEAGRVIAGRGFQPAPFAAWGLTPETLRAIADLIDGPLPAQPQQDWPDTETK